MLKADGLKLSYRDGESQVAAVDGVSLELSEGEFVGVMGPSGSGKSSLLYLLAGLKRPTSGRVDFRGSPLEPMGIDDLASLRRSSFGFVFQNSFLIGYLTGLENVLSAAPEEEGRAGSLLEALGLGHCGGKFPYQMSAGERQRISIARALLRRPAVVFADEPTAALDRASAEGAMDCLRKQAGGSALVVVTHDESVLRGAGRVLKMRAGRLEKS